MLVFFTDVGYHLPYEASGDTHRTAGQLSGGPGQFEETAKSG